MNGRISQEEAPRVAEVLGRVHGASARTGFDRAPFQNRDDFRAIRIEPYLTETTRVHPDLRAHIAPLEARLYESSQVLVHGDVSPKNILFRDRSAVLLDAECATMGDASFDAAFCLNHLILKAIHVPRIRAGLFKAAARFWEVYADHIHWEDPAALEKRVCALLPVLMLARVDGKSPVEYLGVDEQEHVRHIAKPLTLNPPHRISSFVAALRKACP
ncbi:MAG: phosphotransferase [Pseudomonadota bacterium]